MTKYMTTAQASALWNITTNRITILAKEGRIPNVIQMGSRWLIPIDTIKPLDGRIKKAKSNKKEDLFRFPIFLGKPIEAYNPPLTKDELQLKDIIEKICACEFEKAENIIGDLPSRTDNLYVRITSLVYSCYVYSILNKPEKFFFAYAQLQNIFQNDFAHKKEMELLLIDLEANLKFGVKSLRDFSIDPNYPYDKSFLPHLVSISVLSLFYSYDKIINDISLSSFEINLSLIDESENPLDVITIHLYLGYIYNINNNQEKSIYHLRKCLELVEKTNIYWLIASEYHYASSIIKQVFPYFKKEFVKKIIDLSNDFHQKTLSFINSSSTNNILDNIPQGKLIYIFYAIEGYYNKEIADFLHISEKTVSKTYSDIYQALGIGSKKELIELYKELFNQPFEQKK